MVEVLIIEDEDFLRFTLEERLRVEGFNVLSAPDGETGVSMAARHVPDIILCDIMLPGIDGYGVVEALHQMETTANIPFIFLTAKTDTLDVRRGMTLGADDYLCKPIAKEDLLAAIYGRIRARDRQKALEQNKLDHLRARITGGVPKELLEPLQNILAPAGALEYANSTTSLKEINQWGHDIRKNAQKLYRNIQRFLFYSDLVMECSQSALPHLAVSLPCEVKKIIEEEAWSMASEWTRKQDLVLEVEAGWVQAHEGKLRQLLDEILDNAFKYSLPGTSVILKATFSNQMLRVAIMDQGPGLSGDLLLGVRAFSHSPQWGTFRSGVGLGLAIGNLICQQHQTKLQFASKKANGGSSAIANVTGGETETAKGSEQLCNGTCVEFTLPQVVLPED
jgi:DNA-binding response OmpR family regulator/anti-sigma regulatory factor (Ser/Thr protein kinase)